MSAHTQFWQPPADAGGVQRALLVSEKEAARLLGISTRTLFSLRASSQIPFLRIGNRVRYDVKDLQGYVDRQKVGAAPGR